MHICDNKAPELHTSMIVDIVSSPVLYLHDVICLGLQAFKPGKQQWRA